MTVWWQIKNGLILGLAAVFGFIGGTATGNVILHGSPVPPLSVEALQAQKARQFTIAIRKSGVLLPDSRTFLEAAHSSGKTLILDIGTTRLKKSINGSVFLSLMKNSVIDVLCGDDGERDVLTRGGDRRYVYHDPRGAYIGEFRVSARDCETVT